MATTLKYGSKRDDKVTGIARKELEKELGRTVVFKKNYLGKPGNKNLLNQ